MEVAEATSTRMYHSLQPTTCNVITDRCLEQNPHPDRPEWWSQ